MVSAVPQGLMQLNDLRGEIDQVQRGVQGGKKRVPFFHETINLEDPKSSALLFQRIQERLGEIFANYQVMGNGELTGKLAGILTACQRAYACHEQKAGGIFGGIFKSGEKKLARERFDEAVRMLDGLSQINEYCLAEEEERQGEVEEHAIRSLQALRKLDPKVARKIVRRQAEGAAAGISQVWMKTKSVSAHQAISEIEGNLSLERRGGEPSANLKKRLKKAAKCRAKLEQSVFDADLGSEQERADLSAHLKSLLGKYQAAKRVLGVLYTDKQKFEEATARYAYFERWVSSIVSLLDTVSAMPKTFEELKSEGQIEDVKRFCRALGELSLLDPPCARKLLKQLGNKTQNPVLQHLSDQARTLDYEKIPINIRLAEAFASMRPAIGTIKAEEITGDTTTLDLRGCSPQVAASLLQRFSGQVKRVKISSEFLLSEEFLQLKPVEDRQEWGRVNFFTGEPNVIKGRPGCILENVVELEVAAQDRGQAVPLTLEQLDAMVTVFPHCRAAELPSFEIHEIKGAHLRDFPLDKWMEFYNFAQKVGQTEERFHHAIVRSLLQSKTLDDFKLEKLNDYQSHREMSPVHYLALFVNAEKTVHPTPSLISSLNPSDWQQAAYLLLGAGKFSEWTLPTQKEWQGENPAFHGSSLGKIDFSNNPLLSDGEFAAFLERKDEEVGERRFLSSVKRVSNAEKIKRLKLKNCPKLSNESVRKLLLSAPSLEVLKLNNNPQLTDEIFRGVPKERFAGLKFLDLRGTAVTRATAERLRKEFPKLRILWSGALQASMQLYQEREEKGDLNILSGTRSYKLHKEMLLAASSQLKEVLSEKEGGWELRLPKEVSEKGVQALIRFLYKGAFEELDDETAFELLDLLRQADVSLPALVGDLREWLIRTMTPENALSRYRMAERENFRDIADGALRFIDLFMHPGASSIAEVPFENNEEIAEALKREAPISLLWLDKESYDIPLKLQSHEEEGKAVVSVNFADVRPRVPPELYPQVEQAIQDKFAELGGQGPLQFDLAFWSGTMKVEASRKMFDGKRAIDEGVIEADAVLKLPARGTAPPLEVPVNRAVLASRAPIFAKLFEGMDAQGPIEVSTKRPKAFQLMIEALLRGREVDLKGLSLAEVVDLLKEADKYFVTEEITNLGSLDAWLGGVRPGAEEMAWIDLLKWASQNHHPPIGLRVVQRFIGLFDKGELKEPWRSDPAVAKAVLAIATSPYFEEFRSLWAANQGLPILDYMRTSSSWI